MMVCGVVVFEGCASGVVLSGGSWSTSMLVVSVEFPSWLGLVWSVLLWRLGGVCWFAILWVGGLEVGGLVFSIS